MTYKVNSTQVKPKNAPYGSLLIETDTERAFVRSRFTKTNNGWVRVSLEIDEITALLDTAGYTKSTGNTGGAVSAGVGNQYVELEIGGTVYKVLHDGTL